MTEKKNAISQAQIDEWKAQFGHVYKTAMGNDPIIYRPIMRSEYKKLIAETEIPIEDEQNEEARAERLSKRQEGVCMTAVLYPETIAGMLERFAGLAVRLSDEIMDHSGFNALAASEEL